ncbi:MAG: hypothetical protein R3304_10790 [Longimicrobiales bacterium]|nr:hypothetical protein [Longimicrobiales bacterium]
MFDAQNGVIVDDAVVLVEDGRIAAVHPGSVPDGAREIDLGDATLMPGSPTPTPTSHRRSAPPPSWRR